MLSLNLSELDDALPLLLEINPPISEELRNTNSIDPADALTWCLAVFSAGECPGDGRSIWLTKLSLFCNERGVPEQELLNWALGHGPLLSHTPRRITSTIRGTYARKRHDHSNQPYTPFQRAGKHASSREAAADFAQKAVGEPDETSAHTPASFSDTPSVPENVYEALPLLLRNAVAPFTQGRERDVMLTSTLAVLSGCFPTLCGVYDGTRYGANLFAFIVGPPGSGKGALGWARSLAAPAHAERVAESKRLRDEYTIALAEYAAAKRIAATGASVVPPPVEPGSLLLFIPANNSAANILKLLHENEGKAIICENEADTLTTSLRQDWGNFSDLLRKAFHHEPTSCSRKTNREYLEIERPCLSIALTGTPGQVTSLIPSGENGLFSRVLFYCFNPPPEWRDVGPGGGREELEEYFADLSRQVHNLMGHLSLPGSGDDNTVRVALTPSQWDDLNATGRRWLSEGQAMVESEGAAGVAFRLGLSMFRVTMLLTLLRAVERGKVPVGRLLATDDDLNTALALGDVYLAHSLALLARMPRPTTGLVTPRARWADKSEKEKRVRELHTQGMSLRDIAQQTGVSKSTVERWVK